MLDAMLIHPKEKRLKPVVYSVSALVWLCVVCSLVGALYGLVLIPFVLMGHAYFLGHVRGSGVRVDAHQLPDLYARVVRASQKLNLSAVPEVYVLQSGGLLNAFATQLFSRKYVVLYSNLIDDCHTDDELEFIIAHELAHHAAGHLKLQLFTAPVRLIPLLGPAYSRACEYTCDRAAFHAVGSLEPSQRALSVLAAGTKASLSLDLSVFASQQRAAGEFWPAVAELGSTHPYLSKRVAALGAFHAERAGESASAFAPPYRPAFSYVLSVFFGQQAITLVAVAYIAIVAAIALPNFKKFQERSRNAAAQHSRNSTVRAEPEELPE
jgi:Zn-dependent protease with chaperone function